jgi:hypothetical protein
MDISIEADSWGMMPESLDPAELSALELLLDGLPACAILDGWMAIFVWS